MTNQGKAYLLAMQRNAQFIEQKIQELISYEVLEGDIEFGVLNSYGATIEEVATILLNNLRLVYAAKVANNDTKPSSDTNAAGAA